MLNRLEMLRLFCAAADASSFKEAAARLGTSPQAITRAVKELEEAMGEVLFHRNTRGIQITEFGTQLAEHAREMVTGVDKLFHHTNPLSDTNLEGLVRITAPSPIGRRHLLKLLLPLIRQYPGIKLELGVTNLLADVVDKKIDIGVRIGPLRDSRLVARSVGKVSFFVVATPELVATRGKPTTPQDLLGLPTTALMDGNTGRIWPWYFADSQPLTLASPTLVSDDPEVECDAVLAGIGYGQLSNHQAEPHIRSGRLVTVLDDYQPVPWDLYVYRPQRGPVPARIRLVFDRIVDILSDPNTFAGPP
ncbi:LysR family transcriptional regulator [Herminiimonas sp. NPDC097707]|uniref:LysR family transcriptional regulator n=1 Tax=Herminiimonas sp. NPDC097707 TaxID=3364007 RepID=UPI00383BB0D9